MSLSAYALVSLEEARAHLGLGGNAKDAELELIVNRVSDEIERYLGRQIVTRGSLTEYHTMQSGGGLRVCHPDLRTLEWPIITVTSVHEDTATPRAYGAAALLVEGTGYEVVKPKGLIRRIEGLGVTRDWSTGHRAIKVVYSAGYADVDSVPARIKSVALRYLGLMWGEAKRGDFGISGQADAVGNYTRFTVAHLTPEMRVALVDEARHSLWESGERDA